MCGRFTLITSIDDLTQQLELDEAPDVMPPRYNIAPSQPVAVVRLDLEREARTLAMLRWGLVPFWAKDPKIGYRMINARSETAAEKPAFRAAFRRRRCLVPADGFYEWQKTDGRKVPHFIHMADHAPFAIAGLWELWRDDAGQTVESCTLLTTTPNDLVRPLHDRMPVILAPEDHALWLDPTVADTALLQPLLRPFPPDAMAAYAVSTHVNSPANEDPRCVVPIDA